MHQMIVYRCGCPQDSVDICSESCGDEGHCQNHESNYKMIIAHTTYHSQIGTWRQALGLLTAHETERNIPEHWNIH
jgi:hypothetical protein